MRLYFLLTILILCACDNNPDPYLRFDQTFSQDGINKCVDANPSTTAKQCNIKNCLSNRIILKGIDNLLRATNDVLNDLSIRYWLEGASLLGALRFKAYLPWDDDADIGVLAPEFEPYLPQFKRALETKGYRLIEFGGHFGTSVGFWQVLFTHDGFKRHILETDPDISSDEADRLVAEYDLQAYLPHLDIFPYDEISRDRWQIRSSLFSGKVPEGFAKDTLVSLNGAQKQKPILDGQFSIPNNLDMFLKTWYHVDNVIDDFVIESPHSSQCSKRLRFRDVGQHPELIKYFKDYLKFVFDSRFRD